MSTNCLNLALAILLSGAPSASRQSTSHGTLVGVVRDPQGRVVPGASVTLEGAALMGERTALTEIDGSYRFRALGPGDYNLRFEMAGFSTLVREGIIVTIGTTITMNVSLQIAEVRESIVVTGASPTIDVKTTRIGGTFDESALQDVPSATDMWAVLAQSPGIRMRGYDVGGSHKSQQTAYESFGIREQSRVVSDGVDSTESTGYAGFYYDYYAVEEFQVSSGGADVEMTSPGALVSMSVKSGGNELSGLFHLDTEGASMVGDNIDEELAERGFTGNPNLLFWEAHADLGGPIVKDKLWFYGAYNHFKIDKAISGVDPTVATDIGVFDNYTAKLSFAPSEKDRLIGYSQWGRKQKPNRGLSLLRPEESTVDQDTWTWVHKAEWQRIWSSRAFSNFQVKHYGLGFDFVTKSDSTNASRLDTATGRWSGPGPFPGSGGIWKPQVSSQLSYYFPTPTAGSHDLKFGFEYLLDSYFGGNSPRVGSIRYFDNSSLGRPRDVDEILLANTPRRSENRNTHLDFYIQDIWTVSDRLTLSLGVRVGRQHAHYSESELNPTLTDFFPTGTRPGASLVTWLNAAPRLGATFDPTGSGKTVTKAYYGRYYVNIADTFFAANPNGAAIQRYKFADPNENGLYDGPEELGPLVFQTSDGEGTPVNPDLSPSYADEYSVSVEHELAVDTSVRLSYVHKTLKNDFGIWNRAQQIPLLESPVPCGDDIFPCPLDPFTKEPLDLARVPDEAAGAQDVLYDTFPDAHYAYDTIQVAVNRRFNRSFFVQGSFDYQWRDELRNGGGDNQDPLVADPLDVGKNNESFIFWQNHSLDVGYRQESTNWQGKILARYVFPGDLSVSANLRHQSGWPWAPIFRVPVPGSGTQPVFLEDVDNNRSENVTILDLRAEKTFVLSGRHRLSAMLDIYNLTNGNPETNFSMRTGGGFRAIIAALDPRTFKIGLRWQF